MMSHLFASSAAQMKSGRRQRRLPPVSFNKVISSNSHLTELGKKNARDGLPESNPKEIREDILKLCS
jgi:hypothetical protein